MKRIASTLGAMVAFTTLPSPARAQNQGTLAAEALFREGVALMDAGEFARACPAFEESARIERAGGTLFRLAECREAEGKTASAWVAYEAALAEAVRRGNAEKTGEVRERIQALEPRLVRLRIIVSPELGALAGVIISREGVVLGPGAWGLALPVDPGKVSVLAVAKGMKPATTTVDVRDGDSVVEIVLPMLETLPATEASMATQGRDNIVKSGTTTLAPRVNRAQLTLGWVGVGSAAAAMAATIALQVHVSSLVERADPHCPNGCDATGHGYYERAKTTYWASVGTGVAAGLLGSAGAVLLILAPRTSPSSTVSLGPGTAYWRQRF